MNKTTEVSFDSILLERPGLRILGLMEVWIESPAQCQWESVEHVYGKLDLYTLALVIETLIRRGAKRFCLLVEEGPGGPFGTDYSAKELTQTVLPLTLHYGTH